MPFFTTAKLYGGFLNDVEDFAVRQVLCALRSMSGAVAMITITTGMRKARKRRIRRDRGRVEGMHE